MNRNHDETSEALVAAAHRLLADAGPEALTVRRIANEADMSTMNVYSRFGGKDGVIDVLYTDGYRRLFAVVDAVPTTDDIATDILQVAREYRRWALENPQYYGIMFERTVAGYEPGPESVEVALGGLSNFIDRVRLGQDRGQITSSMGHEPVEIGAWLWASCHGMVSFELNAVGVELISWESVFVNGMRTALGGLHPSAEPADSTA